MWLWDQLILCNGRHNPALNSILALFDGFLISVSMCDTSRQFRDSYHKNVISTIPLDDQRIMSLVHLAFLSILIYVSRYIVLSIPKTELSSS